MKQNGRQAAVQYCTRGIALRLVSRANELIKQYGDLADIEAAARADQYEAKGERDGQRVWMRIARAIDDLQKVQPGATKH